MAPLEELFHQITPINLIAKNYLRCYNNWKYITNTDKLAKSKIGTEELQFSLNIYNQVTSLIDMDENVIMDQKDYAEILIG